MHRIDTPDATRDGRFTEGDPSVPVPATTVSADWLNAVQEEVLAVMTAAGLAPAKNDNAQLLAALKNVVGTVNALTATRLETARQIDGVSFDGTADIHHYATCATASGTAAKTAALAGFRLQAGAALRVKFANANTAANATLNVGGTGAKPLHYHGKAVPAGLLAAGHTYAVVYNGTQYEIIGDILVLEPGGGLAFDAKGHLFVDFSLVPPEQMRSIVLSMMQQGGGLNVDGKGKLYVDFASMPTDRFESMLKSIRVPIWFSSHKTFYVNIAAGSDTLDEGRGESASKPFKTIRAALSYVTSNYNLNVYNCIIKLAAGDYTTGKRLTLPGYTTTTGRIYIDGPTEDPAEAIIDAPGISTYSTYSIRNITCKMYNYATGASIGLVSAYYGTIYLQNVILDCTNYEIPKGMIYPLYANNGGIINIWSTSVGVPNGVKIKVSDPIGEAVSGIGALLYASASSTIAYVADIKVIGNATMKQCTARVTGLGQISRGISSDPNPGRYPNFSLNGTIIGKRYSASGNGIINVGGGGPDFYPGTVAGDTLSGGQYF